MPNQTAPAKNPDQPSTKHLVVDWRFAAILHEDFPTIPAATILDALSGEPCKRAIAICEWASTKDGPAHALICGAGKHHKGQHRQRCRRIAGTPPERFGCDGDVPPHHRPAPVRASTPPSGADVASGGWGYLDPRVIAAGFAKMGV